MSYHSHKRKAGAVRVLSILLFLFVTAGLVILAGRFGNRYLTKRAQNAAETGNYEESDIVTANGIRYRKKKYLKTYLVMGIDKAEASRSLTNINSQQTDFNALIVVDLMKESCRVLFINRDTMTDIPVLALDGTPYTTRYQQLALSHTYGSGMEDSCENTVKTVSELLDGAVIDHYAACYLGSIGILNQAVGGVTVTVKDDLTDVDPSLYPGATVTLDAAQAEHFVRSRMTVADGTNLNRMDRQRTYLEAWQEQASSIMEQDADFALRLAEQLSPCIVTDLTVQQLSDLAEALNSYQQEDPMELAGETVMGETYIEYYPDEEALQETILELFYEECS